MPLGRARLLAESTTPRLVGLADARFGLRPFIVGLKRPLRLANDACGPAANTGMLAGGGKGAQPPLGILFLPGCTGAAGFASRGNSRISAALIAIRTLRGTRPFLLIGHSDTPDCCVEAVAARDHWHFKSKSDARRIGRFGTGDRFRHQEPSIHHARKPTRPTAAPIQALNSWFLRH